MSNLAHPSSETSQLTRPGMVTYLGPALLLSVSVFYMGTTNNGPELPLPFTWRDKVGHALAFGLVAWTYFRAAMFLRPQSGTRTQMTIGFFGAVFAGALLEVVQFFLPYRSAEFLDLVADAVGAAVPLAVVFMVPRERSGELTK